MYLFTHKWALLRVFFTAYTSGSQGEQAPVRQSPLAGSAYPLLIIWRIYIFLKETRSGTTIIQPYKFDVDGRLSQTWLYLDNLGKYMI